MWNSVLEQAELLYDEVTFTELFSACKYNKFESGYIYIVTPNEFIKSKLSKFHYNKINEIVSKITTEKVMLKFVLESELVEKPVIQTNSLISPHAHNLRHNYTFENFVVGESNRFAFNYALKVADQPGMVANPLYIFGNVGLGKTHLMQAVGHFILENDINKRVIYVKADQFIEDYTKFCKGKMDDFQDKYRNLDVLLIDDIQVLEIGQKSQIEFFKVFDILSSDNKQIIITSDRKADDLKLMARLTSRFSAGLNVDIQTPNLNHRVSILKKKVLELTNLPISDDVLEYIASIFNNNIRELEGAFTRVLYYCEAINLEINLENAQEALGPLISNKKISSSHNETNFVKVQDVVSSFFEITMDDMIGSKRQAKIVLARHIAMYILKTKYGLSYKKIGSLFSGRDHSTIINGCDRIEQELKVNGDIKMALDTIMKKID